MKKGFMMNSRDFNVTSIQTSDSQQEAASYGIQDAVVKPSATNEMASPHHNAVYKSM